MGLKKYLVVNKDTRDVIYEGNSINTMYKTISDYIKNTEGISKTLVEKYSNLSGVSPLEFYKYGIDIKIRK